MQQRRAFIKNVFGAVLGYALLPKCLTEATNELKQGIGVWEQLKPEIDAMPGIGGNTFKIKLNKDWFCKGDLIECETGQALLEEETETGFKGRFVSGTKDSPMIYSFIEIDHSDNHDFIQTNQNNYMEVHEQKVDKIKDGYIWSYKLVPDLKVRKICSVIQDAEIC